MPLRVASGLAVLALLVLPLVAPWLNFLLANALSKGLAVLGVMVLLRAGQVSFGHALYFATSAYTAAFLIRALGTTDLFLALLVGTVGSVLLSLLVGLFVVRYRYIFFGMLNLAFSMVAYALLEKFFYVTGGADGLRVPRPTVLGFELERGPYELVLVYTALALAIGCGWFVQRYFASAPGRALAAIDSNETRLEYLGISAKSVLLGGYVLSAALAGLGGVLLAAVQGVVTPEFAYWVRSGEFVFIAVLGGAGHVVGAFAGAFVYELVRTYAAAFATDIWQLVLGSVLLLVILFAPGGIVGLLHRPRRRASANAAAEPAGE